jgi:hypothetical protein
MISVARMPDTDCPSPPEDAQSVAKAGPRLQAVEAFDATDLAQVIVMIAGTQDIALQVFLDAAVALGVADVFLQVGGI